MPRVRTATKADRIVKEANERGVGPTPERLRRAGEAVEPANFDADKHNHYDTIRLMDGNGGLLDQLIREGKINTDQYHAGLRLFRDFWLAEVDAVRALDWTRPVVDSQPTIGMSDNKLDAINSVKKATAKLEFIGMHPFIKMIVQGQSAVEYGRERWPIASRQDASNLAKGALYTTLAILDEFYYGKRRARVVSGGVEGYRPSGLTEDRQ
jgi:hypothetical protein